MALATLSIDLVAKVASFEADLKRVAASTERQANRMSDALGLVAGGLAGLAAGLSVGAFTGFIKNINDGVDALNDIADATGASIENISGLEEVALRTGTSVDTVSGALVKFNQTLNSADPNSNAAKALEAIGLNAEELKRIDPAEALRLTAVALSQFADDGNKARLVQELFGKSVKEVAPFLKDLAEAGQLNARVTAEQAAEADKFNKQIFQLQANVQALARSLVGDLITGLNRAAEAYRNFGVSAGLSTLIFGDDELRNNKRLTELTNDLVRAENELSASRAKDAQFGDRSARTASAEKRLALIKAELQTVQAYRKVLETPLNAPKAPPSIVLPNSGNPAAGTGRTSGARAGKSDAQRAAEQDLKLQREVAQLYADRRNDEREAEDKAVEANIKASEREAEEQYRIALKASQDRQALRNAEYELVIEQVRRNAEDAEKLIRSNADAIGESFGKAFEDAVIGGKKLSDVLKSLAQDIASIVLRQTVTEPLANQVSGILRGSGGSSIFSDLFGSVFGFASGGDHRGGLRIVGENGPELEATGPSRIFSADQTRRMLSGGGGGSVVNNFTIQGPVDRRSEAQIAKAAQRGLQRAQRWL
jgi:hypothetical protein